MNVLLLANEDGMNPYATQLAAGLEAHGHDVSFSYRTVLPLLSGYYESDPDVIHFQWIRKFVLDDSLVLTLVRIAQFFLELVVLRLVSDAPIVWTVHNRREHKGRWPTVERRVKHAFATTFCDRVIVHCSAAEDAVIEELGLPERVRRRVHVVPHGNYVDVYENSVTEAEARERLDLPADERVFLFIGSIRPYKQVPSLVAAFERADVGDARLVVAGKPWNDEVRARIESGAAGNDRIQTILDVIPGEEFQIYLNAADAVVLPFDERVLTSGSVVIAMSFGTPVVVPRVGCLPETVPEDGGILYDPAEPEALRRAIETAADADLDAQGRRSLAAARDADWPSVARRTERVYETARSS
ncbi:glycosyltransferase family 4 protein [Halorussus litoreus]|uniref:glycosyltransferase family 4 protein n=1 Tax=Halorussus litoreus TaxID=1710536 RepID=UPI000E26EC73|nr:glycosyltransferase family 4 protein [Halorussus litoreus]